MGKPSKASRKNDIIRLQRRQKLGKIFYENQIKKKEEEIGDLQIEVQQLKTFIEEAKEEVINRFTQSNREKNSLLEYIFEKEILRTAQSQPSQPSQSSQSSQSSQPFF